MKLKSGYECDQIRYINRDSAEIPFKFSYGQNYEYRQNLYYIRST
jgi:hypothetical protein